ncbi:calcium-independent phospholipase A2-gamma-like isoform X2 [Megalops cyprinoides]|uniref:calcium-independent phospholipase A2-gamma-like isoform X2 n=1 Tax=Megalops cyprinoides TaxID=118141 RepID=UPI0018653FD5|nr:calcium-independent phospholipase A2-gamma-like isoform X2 [Megalops cyprinoides]
MGLYPTSGLCTSRLGGKRGRLCRKLRYLLAILRTLPHLTKPPLPQELRSCAVLPLAPPPSLVRHAQLRHARSDGGSFSCLPSSAFSRRGLEYKPWLCESAARSYSNSSRDSLKGEAPIGVWEETKGALQLSYLGARLGESFQYLSKHINAYFKGEEERVQTLPKRAGVGHGAQGSVGGRLRRSYSQRQAKDKQEGEEGERSVPPEQAQVQEVLEEQTSAQPPAQAHRGIHLFHISSLANRFGESYSYVARHINSVFSVGGPASEVQSQAREDETVLLRTRRRRRKTIKVISQAGRVYKVSEREPDFRSVRAEDSRTEEEGHLYLAQRINSYFSAKMTDSPPEPAPQNRTVITPTSAVSQQHSGSSPGAPVTNQESLAPRSPGLFHISNLATSFGESYAQMANHINQYFKGPEGRAEEAELEQDRVELGHWGEVGGAVDPPQQKPLSFMQCLLEPRTAIPDLLRSYLQGGSQSQMAQPAPQALQEETAWSCNNRPRVFGRKEAENMTRFLVGRVQQADNHTSLAARIEALNEHLIQYPACKVVAWQERAVLILLGQRRCYRDNQELQGAIREALALIGYVDSVKGRGIRILSIDGGGTRGVVPLQVLKRLEAATGRQVHQLFDYVCGVSTAVLAFMLALARISLEECEELYLRFGSDIFRQNPFVGTVKMGWTHSYYNTATWEGLLRKMMSDKVLIKTARDPQSPKVSAVSAVVNWGTTPKPFIFRNYNHAPGRLSRYAGASGYQLWQAVRASSAAPGYFQEFPLQSDIHQDGGLILNNPCALAIHESRLLWPTQPFQCVLSLGTGRYDSAKRGPATSTSLRAKISNLISSATDTEGVHTLLDDLMSADVYFRFNPMLSAEVSLDESRPNALELLRSDTELYLDRNQHKMERLCKVLGPERRALQLTGDWIGERAWELRQRWS